MPQAETAILTACFGNYDDLEPQPKQDIAVDWIAVTDGQDAPQPWRVTHEPLTGHPNLAAKRHKLTPPLPHRYIIWIDANIRVESPFFAREALSCLNDGIAVHRHPFRDCIYQEALETIFTPKYDDLPVIEQIRHYRLDERFKERQGLYACGVIAWDRQERKARQLGQAWMDECERWGYQDQLSFPVVCQRLKVKPGVFPHDQYHSPWFRVLPHR